MEARHAAAVLDAKLSEVVVETGLVAAAAVAAAAVVAAAVVATSNAKQPQMPTMIALHTRLFKNQMQLSLQTPDTLTSQAWPDCNGAKLTGSIVVIATCGANPIAPQVLRTGRGATTKGALCAPGKVVVPAHLSR